jgi:hypothetical protein
MTLSLHRRWTGRAAFLTILLALMSFSVAPAIASATSPDDSRRRLRRPIFRLSAGDPQSAQRGR